MSDSVKFTEHKTLTTMVTSSPDYKPSFDAGTPRVVRITVTDAYATDSSGDEKDEVFSRRRVRKFVNEVTIEAPLPLNHVPTLNLLYKTHLLPKTNPQTNLFFFLFLFKFTRRKIKKLAGKPTISLQQPLFPEPP